MFDFLDDLLEHASDIIDVDAAEQIVDSIDPDSFEEISLSDSIEFPDTIETPTFGDQADCYEVEELPEESMCESEGNVTFKGTPSRQGSCYDCDCNFFVPKASHPTTCSVCGHSIGRHHISLGK